MQKPKDITEIRDLNTGEAYTETYKRLINDPSKEMLLPVVFYIDAASTGQFVQMPVTALKLTLGSSTEKHVTSPTYGALWAMCPKSCHATHAESECLQNQIRPPLRVRHSGNETNPDTDNG